MIKFPLSLCLLLPALRAAPDPVPRLVSANPSPQYSELAQRAGAAGEVDLQIVIPPQGGTPKSVLVTRQLGWGLDEECAKAVSHWTFRSAPESQSSFDFTTKVECHFNTLTRGDVRFGALAFDLSAGVTKPVLTSFASPDFVREFGAIYPPGKVQFTVNVRGEPENFQVEQPSSPDFEKAVFQALRLWRFEPAANGIEAVPVHASLQYELAVHR